MQRYVTTVKGNDDLQSALDKSEPGDTIELAAGHTFTGNFNLPSKASLRNDFITLRSAMIDRMPVGIRVSPRISKFMPKIVTPNSMPALTVGQGARNWRIQGLEVCNSPNVYTYDSILVGSVDAKLASEQPSNIELDRLYVHGLPNEGAKRGVFLNCNLVKLTDCYISDYKSDFQDAMAVAVCNGPGPYTINNNYLEGAGYSIIFGGCNNQIPEVVPSDITFTRNYLHKPMEWKNSKWVVKNLFEMKMGRRVLVYGNVFENNWAASQSGFGILFTIRANGVDNQGKPFSTIEDVKFHCNKMISMDHGVNISGHDDFNLDGGSSKRLEFWNNLFVDVKGRLFQTILSPQDISIEDNTATSQDFIIVSENVTTGFKMRDNIFTLGTYGIFGSGLGSGSVVLDNNFPGSTVSNNGLVGDTHGTPYPQDNIYLNWVEDVMFVPGTFTLQRSSPLWGMASNGGNPGVSEILLEQAIKGVKP